VETFDTGVMSHYAMCGGIYSYEPNEMPYWQVFRDGTYFAKVLAY